jgi:uncharacterized protein (DUF2147 family)
VTNIVYVKKDYNYSTSKKTRCIWDLSETYAKKYTTKVLEPKSGSPSYTIKGYVEKEIFAGDIESFWYSIVNFFV